jgi:hypothetical protein
MLGMMAFDRAALEGGMLGMIAVGMYILTSDMVSPSIISCSIQMGVKISKSVQYTQIKSFGHKIKFTKICVL